MTNSNLKQLHRAILYIADEIDRICKLENINYTLTGGSLIGAVRHKGFIPWDDDMDIAMLREDYDRFIEACKKHLKDEFFLQTIDTDDDYTLGFAKLTLLGTHYQQAGHKGEKWQKGIFVDIFPMDNVPANKVKKYFHKNINYFLIKVLECKTSKGKLEGNVVKSVIGKLLYFIGVLVPSKKLTKMLTSNMKKYQSVDTLKVCNLAGFYKYEKETTLLSNYNEYKYVEFEDRKYKIISEYDKYLSGVYGDYMKLPPPEKRHTHDFEVLDFGNYTFE